MVNLMSSVWLATVITFLASSWGGEGWRRKIREGVEEGGKERGREKGGREGGRKEVEEGVVGRGREEEGGRKKGEGGWRVEEGGGGWRREGIEEKGGW